MRPSVQSRLPRRFVRVRPIKLALDSELVENLDQQGLADLTAANVLRDPLRGFQHLAHSLFCTHWFLLVASAVSVLFAVPVYPQIPRGDQMMRANHPNKNLQSETS